MIFMFLVVVVQLIVFWRKGWMNKGG
jgi:hypothetical protein